jgi:hypothetical protein
MSYLAAVGSTTGDYIKAYGTVLIATVGFLATLYQLRRGLIFQRETVATTTYREYHRVSIDHPDLASGKCERDGDPAKWDQYTWYVALMLWACELITEYAPKDAVWLASIKAELGAHSKYLASDEFQNEELGLYSERLRNIIHEVAPRPSEKKL